MIDGSFTLHIVAPTKSFKAATTLRDATILVGDSMSRMAADGIDDEAAWEISGNVVRTFLDDGELRASGIVMLVRAALCVAAYLLPDMLTGRYDQVLLKAEPEGKSTWFQVDAWPIAANDNDPLKAAPSSPANDNGPKTCRSKRGKRR